MYDFDSQVVGIVVVPEPLALGVVGWLVLVLVSRKCRRQAAAVRL